MLITWIRGSEMGKRTPIVDRYWAKVDRSGGPDACWPWTAHCDPYGYGHFDGGLAHRFGFALEFGQIQRGLVVDHTCHNEDLDCPGGYGCLHRRCQNPRHWEAVTDEENRRRGRPGGSGKNYPEGGGNYPGLGHNADKTHCQQGHEFTIENTLVTPEGWRACRTCRREWDRRGKARRIARMKEARAVSTLAAESGD